MTTARVTLNGQEYNFFWSVINDSVRSFHINADGSVYANECESTELEFTPDGVWKVPKMTCTREIGFCNGDVVPQTIQSSKTDFTEFSRYER